LPHLMGKPRSDPSARQRICDVAPRLADEISPMATCRHQVPVARGMDATFAFGSRQSRRLPMA
jgi:hypothetical protein